ncbi:C4-dicarboxylate TRAP transporter substrate-binding protein [Alloalcanivorax mobilis]|uniref:C4-dicarboxylate TRAP transporter substrate-binding protein n=1 Tax=Alloalcanivorax mobilis TaxID=2019569 RepID=UPI000B5B458C|nr:C4-dicarboxylate TRAP transporter substrate-binding protein [Alloalcanivorax mobilis]ASK35634.1 C4-dicarboxylate ABC transporter substrate-binding protein [Alcanivorax sp. N3-2A]
MMSFSTRWLLPMAAALVFSAHVDARTISYATGYPPNSIGANAAATYAKTLEKMSDGELKAKVYPMSLLSFSETSPGIRDGMADSGFVLFSYYPSEFPNTNLVSELTMLLERQDIPDSKAGLAYMGAMAEYLFNQCPECVSEFAAQNQVFAGASASAPYMLICNDKVTNLAQIKGKRLRSAGPQWARWAQAVGAAPVTISVSDSYEALGQGVLDCSISSSVDLDIFKLKEVAEHVTTGAPGGVFGGTGVNQINREVWQSLKPEQRKTLLHASAVLGAVISWDYQVGASHELEVAGDSDIEVHAASEDLRQATLKFIDQDIQTIADNYAKRYGIKRADEMVKTFEATLSKWVKLVADVDNPEQLAELYWRETYSKVDVNRYGL